MRKNEYDPKIRKLKGGLNEKDCKMIDAFFASLEEKIDLNILKRNLLFDHFCNAFDYYLDHGYSVKEIVSLMDPEHLGSFYKDNKRSYFSLDNAAIVYPLGMKYGQMPLFRLSADLKEDIVPSILQVAMDFTIKRFPTFSAVIKTGLFWHYLETTSNIPLVEEEKDIPCKPISIILRSFRSFRVFYYKKRISIEYFHAITDGTGGMIFLNSLISEYLRLLNHPQTYADNVLNVDEEVKEEELVNEFRNTTAVKDFNTFLDKSSLQLDGKLEKIEMKRIIHFDMDIDEVKQIAKKYDGSVTAYFLAVLFMASKNCISAKKGLVNIQVPVNMRKFNGSKTLRNYSMYFSASKEINEISDLKELVPDMKQQILEKGREEIMNQMMATTENLIKALFHVPIFLKIPVAQIAYGYLGNSIIASCLSNLGQIKVPEGMEPYISHYDFLLVPARPNRATSTLVSFRDRIRLTITKATVDTKYEEEVYRILKEDGLHIRLEGSEEYES
ncbi:MAG: hypothetical protein IKS51_07715 [Erysipelotrichaceae bacterium]|nr:hypothetical protein [Erysipelotrichaceae bacterium]